MKPDLYSVAAQAALINLLYTPITQAVADTVMNFGDNTNPSSSFPSVINSSAFVPGAEFRLVDPTGNLGGGTPAQKDILTGDEAWSFDDVSGALNAVSNTDMAEGISSSIQSYIDAGYIAPATCNNGCPGLFKGTPLFGATFGFVAPLAGTIEGATNGPAALQITSSNSFEIHFPVFEAHWAGVHFLLGMDQNTGVTFNCSGQPSSNFRCHMEHTITSSEDPAAAGFPGWTVQMEITSMASAAVSIDVAGGALQECVSHNGNAVILGSNISTTPGVTVDSVDWIVDGVSAGSGTSIQKTLAVGAHLAEIIVLTSDGVTTSGSQVVTIQDTTPPDVAPAFVSPFMGATMGVLDRLFNFVKTNFNVSDICDATPTVEGVLGKEAVDGEFLWVTKFNGAVRLQADSLSLKVIATDASGNVNVGEANLVINP